MLVDVLFPINANAFTYLVPDFLKPQIKIGLGVIAPFKKEKRVGIVTQIEAAHPVEESTKFKFIEAVVDKDPLVPEKLLKLIHWVGDYYLSTPGMALKIAIPSGIFEGKKGGKSRITYDKDIKPAQIFNLTSEQKKALSEIARVSSGVFLLHGVTGSGKTEVYLRAIESLPGDKEAIVLVPEIALTSQIIDRFRSRFRERVAFYHSGLSSGERLTQWWKMKRSEVRIVLGVRSAIFAPFKNLGLIIIDEEQESSYKQFEGLRYNARDVALVRAKIEGIKIILGSATPSVETFHQAQKKRFKYLELKNRIDQKPLPHIEIIDMKKEEKKTVSLSNKLFTALKENFSKGRQSLLLLNRRGYSPFLLCADCGYVYRCPLCSITLTYHKVTKSLNCHYCNSSLRPENFCPRCRGARIRYIGTGTQRIEEELLNLLPNISLKRMDRDTTRRKLSHYRIVKEMEERKLDILLGTQMVAKGHDFPLVSLSAVVFADVTLNLPDFRSGEKAFQLFTQLAGRAGRGNISGEVYIQTYEPEHYVFKFIKHHDYKGFYKKEIELRKELLYPPFSKLLRIILNFKKGETVKEDISKISDRIKELKTPEVEILGPAPAPIERLRNLWRWHLILKGKNSRLLRERAKKILEIIEEVKDLKIEVDVDPVNLL